MTSKPTTNNGSARHFVRPVVLVTVFSVAGYIVNFLTQIIIARLFGSGTEMDAFVAGSTLPDYSVAVLISVLNVVFIPVFVDFAKREGREAAWIVASSVINMCLLVLGIIVCVSIFFSEPILRLTVPGLSNESLSVGARVAHILWPSILAIGLFNLLTGIHHAEGRFGWPAVVPLIGWLVNLGLVITLAPSLSVISLAVATTVNLVLQAVLIARVAWGRYRVLIAWNHPGVRQVIYLLWPLIVAGFLTRWTPVVERFLVSDLPIGSISHLNYALKLVEAIATVISVGISVVIFPVMALRVSERDIGGLRRTISLGLRIMWLGVAPAIAIGFVLALPLITLVFQRGEFNSLDSEAVATLFRIYLLALGGMSLATVTGRSFYALKDTRTPSVIGVIQSIVYVIYTALLVHYLGIIGAAIGYAIYFDLSFLWQVFIIRHKTGRIGGGPLLRSFVRTGVAAILAGIVTWITLGFPQNPWLQAILGGLIGLGAYIMALIVLRSPEMYMLWRTIVGRFAIPRK